MGAYCSKISITEIFITHFTRKQNFVRWKAFFFPFAPLRAFYFKYFCTKNTPPLEKYSGDCTSVATQPEATTLLQQFFKKKKKKNCARATHFSPTLFRSPFFSLSLFPLPSVPFSPCVVVLHSLLGEEKKNIKPPQKKNTPV